MKRSDSWRSGRKLAQTCTAVITAVLVLLLLFVYFRYDRRRTLRSALERVQGEPVRFSAQSGFFTEGFTLKLERDPVIPEGIEIRYTTDGDEPTEDSPLYENGIDLSEVIRRAAEEKEAAEAAAAEEAKTEEEKEAAEEAAGPEETENGENGEAGETVPTIEESRAAWRKEKAELVSEFGVRAEPVEDGICVIPVRARLVQGEDKSEVVTRTYVIGSGVKERYGAYVACVTTDSYHLFDYDHGIMIKGSHYQKDIDGGARVDRSGNYYHTGDEWIKDAHVTLFSPDGTVLLEEEAGLSVAGFSSRNLPIRSLRLEASRARGTSDDAFRLDIFSGESRYSPGPAAAEDPESAVRAGDAMKSGNVGDTGNSGKSGNSGSSGDTGNSGSPGAEEGEDPVGNEFRLIRLRTHGAPQIHIRSVRGEYAKILTDECGFPGLTENRLGTVYLNGEFYMVCDIAPSPTKEYLSRLFGLNIPDAMEKYDGNDYDIFKRSKILPLLTSDLTQEENCARLEEAVDMDNYLFYYAIEVLLNNSDWPFNNVTMWRYQGEPDPENPYTDGRFRFVLDDMDQILTNGLHSMPEHWSTECFDYLMKDEKSTFHHVMDSKKYRDTFLTYIDDLLQTAFEPAHGCAILDDLYAQMEKEYRTDYGEAVWTELLESAEITKNNVREKESLFRADVTKYLNLTERYAVRLEAGEGVTVSWNNMSLGPGETWENEYYRGTSFDVTAQTEEGYRFAGWEVSGAAAAEKDAASAGAGKSAGTDPSSAEADPGLRFTVRDTLAGEGSGAGLPAVTIRAAAEKIP